MEKKNINEWIDQWTNDEFDFVRYFPNASEILINFYMFHFPYESSLIQI